MRFLTVADRELRAAARRTSTHRVRWITAAVFFGLLLWLLWGLDGFTVRGAALEVFRAYSLLSFVYCIIIGTAVTADCLSAERREGTLGLLFLTNLSSAEIVAGKFCSTALTAVYGLAAIFPMLALPLLMGGITLAHFWKTVLALLVTTFFSLSAGFVATVICRRQFLAIAFALALGLSFGAGLMAVAAVAQALWQQNAWADELAAFCPLYSLMSAEGTRLLGTNHYWFSIIAVTGMSAFWLALATWRLARTWRDQTKGARASNRFPFQEWWQRFGSSRRIALRRRLLKSNPFFWLGGRRAVSSPGFMVLGVILVATGALVAGPFFARTIMAGAVGPIVGYVFGWFWTVVAIHLLTAYFAAMAASQRLAEDKETGALELILSTPTSERTISRGLWLAYARRMLFPALLATFAHLLLTWQLFTAVMLETPNPSARTLSEWQIFWRALFGTLGNGDGTFWHVGFMLHCLLLALGLLMLSWISLGWVGRWLALRMKHSGFAPVVALALVFVPPGLVFSMACYLVDVLQLRQWPEQQFLPVMMWLAAGIGITHCVLLAGWARRHLRRDFRAEVMNRFQPTPALRWRYILLRVLRRLAIGAGVSAAGLTVIVLLFYGYQNWQSQRRWTAFEHQLKQQGRSFDFVGLQPKPVPNESNFVHSPAFQSLRHVTNSLANLLEGLRIQNLSYPGPANPNVSLAWTQQRLLPLADAATLLASNIAIASPRRLAPRLSNRTLALVDSNRTDAARQLLQRLERFEEPMNALALSARRPFFQLAADRSALEFLNSRKPELEMLEKVQRIFVLRACAGLEMKRSASAAEDLLTSLRLAGLARQCSDIRSTPRAQAMLTASLQPLWEGILRHQWTEDQLTEVQKHLAQFDFLLDYTNAVPRTTVACIETWLALSRDPQPRSTMPVFGSYLDPRIRRWQPRKWWLDHCIQLHKASDNAVAGMDVASGRIVAQANWNDLNGLPLDPNTRILFQQPLWQGVNSALVAFAQSALNQAIIGCALERQFLMRGHYPETLEALQPAFPVRIPNDPLRGPMSYERLNEHEYILRAVGPNQINDQKNRASDDWLWKFPTNAPALN